MAVGRAQTDASGHLATEITVPEDYGGVHNVVARVGETTVAQGGAGAPAGAPGIGTGDGGSRPTPGAPGTVTVVPTQVG